MTLSIANVLNQNTAGNSEGAPLGVPSSYSWYDGVDQVRSSPPSGFTAVNGWGQVYHEDGQPTDANSSGDVQVANAQTYVHLKTTGEWVQVQSQSSDPIAGGHFVTDFVGNAATDMPVSTGADGTATFAAPPAGYNDHFWPSDRGTYPANAVDAVYVQMDMRVTDPNANLIANIGADWWRDATAEYVDGFSNNPGSGMSNWVELSTQWKTLAYSSDNALLQADPPPTLDATAPTSPLSEADPTTPTMAPSQPEVVPAASSPTVDEPSTTIGSGSDELLLLISQDAYKGDAQYTVSVDGQQVGGTQTAHASHADGKADQLLVLGDWGAGDHTVSINFVNDLYEGVPITTDRNLYVDGASYNGADVAGAAHSFYVSGAQSFTTGA